MLINDIVSELKPKKPIMILMYLMEHADDDFIFTGTYSQIQKDVGVSQMTIADTLAKLRNIGSITYLGESRWKINLLERGSNTCAGADLYIKRV